MHVLKAFFPKQKLLSGLSPPLFCLAGSPLFIVYRRAASAPERLETGYASGQMPDGGEGSGHAGCGMLPARGSVCDPKQWEKFSQNFVLTEDLVSCAAPATLALLLLLLLIVLLLLSCTEIPGNKHIRILLLPHLVLPTKNAYLFLRGTRELSKQRGRNHLKLSE